MRERLVTGALLLAVVVAIAGWLVLGPSDAVVAENRDHAPIQVALTGTTGEGAAVAGVVTVMPGDRVTLVGDNGVPELTSLTTIEVLDTACSRLALLDPSQVGTGGAVIRIEDRAATLMLGTNPRLGDPAYPEPACRRTG